MLRNLNSLWKITQSILMKKNSIQRLSYSSKRVKTHRRSLSWLTWTAVVSTAAFTLIPTLPAFARNFQPRVSLQARGRTTIFGNAVTSCSTVSGATGSATCATARSSTTGSYANNDYFMDYVDIDGDSSTFNSSSSTYTFPTSNAGFDIIWAGLYWAGDTSGSPAAIDANKQNQMLLRVPGASTYQTITADVLDTIGTRYSGFANVTDLVKQGKSGTYFGANIQTGKGSDRYGGWALIVIYADKTEILRSMTIFDGFLQVSSSPVTTTISGFLTPTAGPFEAAIGSFSSEGDIGFTGDQFLLDGDGANSDGDGVDQPFKVVSDINNPSTNFFNSSNSLYGTRISTNTSVVAPGGITLGPISRNPNYADLLALDIDIVEAKDSGGNAIMQNKATQAGLQFTTGGDVYYPTAFFFSVEVFQPVLTQNFTKTVTDINGGDVLPGDILEYIISYKNTGNDNATDVILSDLIPANTTYEPNSSVIITDPDPVLTTPAPMTDAIGDDRAEFDSANNKVVFRSGIGATLLKGGIVPFDNPATPVQEADTVTVKFRVKVNSSLSTTPTTISNQATINYKGAFSGTPFSGVSDDPGTTSNPNDPTKITVVKPTPPILLLVKRITAINGIPLNFFKDDTDNTTLHAADDNNVNWPTPLNTNATLGDTTISTFLRGAINGGKVKPGDTIEYTIYFLNAGGGNANNVRVCDRIIDSQKILSGSPVLLQKNSATPTILTSSADTDRATFYASSSDPAITKCNFTSTPTIDNGAIVVDVTGSTGSPTWTTLPGSTGAGTTDTYGFVRFTTKVNP
jgi:uncharacterized repeat protein (TIGR01451 family)